MIVTSPQDFENICLNRNTKLCPSWDTNFTVKIVESMIVMMMLFKYCLSEPPQFCIFNEACGDVTVISILEV